MNLTDSDPYLEGTVTVRGELEASGGPNNDWPLEVDDHDDRVSIFTMKKTDKL